MVIIDYNYNEVENDEDADDEDNEEDADDAAALYKNLHKS